MSTGLLLDEISPSLRTSGTIVLVAVVISTLLAAVVSRATLAPLRDIAAQWDRISAGQYDAPSAEVKGIGASGRRTGTGEPEDQPGSGSNWRGVHEIFSTMRGKHEFRHGRTGGTDCCCSRGIRRAGDDQSGRGKILGQPAGSSSDGALRRIFPPGHPLHGRGCTSKAMN